MHVHDKKMLVGAVAFGLVVAVLLYIELVITSTPSVAGPASQESHSESTNELPDMASDEGVHSLVREPFKEASHILSLRVQDAQTHEGISGAKILVAQKAARGYRKSQHKVLATTSIDGLCELSETFASSIPATHEVVVCAHGYSSARLVLERSKSESTVYLKPGHEVLASCRREGTGSGVSGVVIALSKHRLGLSAAAARYDFPSVSPLRVFPALSSTAGAVRLAGVPSGTYRIRIWHADYVAVAGRPKSNVIEVPGRPLDLVFRSLVAIVAKPSASELVAYANLSDFRGCERGSAIAVFSAARTRVRLEKQFPGAAIFVGLPKHGDQEPPRQMMRLFTADGKILTREFNPRPVETMREPEIADMSKAKDIGIGSCLVEVHQPDGRRIDGIPIEFFGSGCRFWGSTSVKASLPAGEYFYWVGGYNSQSLREDIGDRKLTVERYAVTRESHVLSHYYGKCQVDVKLPYHDPEIRVGLFISDSGGSRSRFNWQPKLVGKPFFVRMGDCKVQVKALDLKSEEVKFKIVNPGDDVDVSLSMKPRLLHARNR